MKKPMYYDGSGTVQPEVMEAALDKKQEGQKEQVHAQKVTDLDSKPSYYDGSGVLSLSKEQ